VKKRILALAVAVCLLFSGCSPITLSVEELMRPPQLSESQRQVHDALIRALGTTVSNVSLRYPNSGDNRSAFTFFDMDGDGQDEALVFYSLTEAPDEVNINLMEYNEKGWYSVYDTPGAGRDVQSLEFASVTRDDGRDIIIGWKAEENSDDQLSVMRYNNNRLDGLYQSSYTEYTTKDINDDGLLELLTVTAPAVGRSYASLISYRRFQLQEISNQPLNVNMTSFSRLNAGMLNRTEQGLVVDGYEGQTFTSELLFIKDEAFVLPFERKSDFYSAIARQQGEVYSRDVNGDGILELPLQQEAPGETELYLTRYCQVDENLALQPVRTAFVEDSRGFAFYLPDEWLGKVTVLETKTGEIIFERYEEDYLTGHQLVFIRVYSEKDYQDKFDTESYKKIGQRGNFRYYASVADDDDLSITYSQVKKLFEII